MRRFGHPTYGNSRNSGCRLELQKYQVSVTTSHNFLNMFHSMYDRKEYLCISGFVRVLENLESA